MFLSNFEASLMASFLTMSFTSEYLKNINSSDSVGSGPNASQSKDLIRISNSYNPIVNFLQNKNVTPMPFFSLLKESSKNKKAPKGFQYQKLVNKNDAYELFSYLISTSKCNLHIKKREINRASYQYRNILLTYFALEYPELMLTVACNQFKIFQFSSHLFEVDVLVQKWTQYVQEIQKIKNQNAFSQIQSNELNICEEITDVSMAPDFVSIDNDDSSFDDDANSMCFTNDYFSLI